MIKIFLTVLLLYVSPSLFAQNKSGYLWIVGANASFGLFDGSPNPPIAGQLFNNQSPDFPYVFASAASNVCDSATGKLLFFSNAMKIWDSAGNVMQNGDSLQPLKIYTQNTPALQGQTQGSLILPKGSTGEYYVFIPTVSDSLYTALWTPDIKTPFDELRYNVVNMNLNGGLGTVTVKNKNLLKNTEMVRTKMQACRHANGYDWWLLKQTGYGQNNITRFLVTKDSIYGPYFQQFASPDWGQYDALGQITFSNDGKKFASVQGKSHKIFIADFDRCSGELSNPQEFNIPIDSTTNPFYDNMGSLDSLCTGVSFSPNGQFIYVSKWWNIYQFEYQVIDSNIAWHRVQHGPDTSFFAFEAYQHLYRGPNGRIYIGKIGGSFKQLSVIDYPDLKGLACGFCRKCFRVDNAVGGVNAPPNMPDYTLGADLSKPCWPLSNQESTLESGELEIYPNPASTVINIQTKSKDQRELYNSVGQLLLTTDHNEIDVQSFTSGIYYIKVGNSRKKIIIE